MRPFRGATAEASYISTRSGAGVYLEVLTLAAGLLGKSNSNALSDLGVASQQAYAELEGAAMNIKINLPSIKDEAFRSKSATEVSSLSQESA